MKLKKKKKLRIMIVVISILLNNNLINWFKKFCFNISTSKFSKEKWYLCIINKKNPPDFEDKLKNLDKKVTSNKTKYVDVEKKITD